MAEGLFKQEMNVKRVERNEPGLFEPCVYCLPLQKTKPTDALQFGMNFFFSVLLKRWFLCPL